MNLGDAFQDKRQELARLVTEAAERRELTASEPLSLLTTVQVRDNGSLTLRQIAAPALTGVVTLTRSQAIELMERIAADVLRETARAMA